LREHLLAGRRLSARDNDYQFGKDVEVSRIKGVNSLNIIDLHGSNDLQIEDLSALWCTTTAALRDVED
jgi:hypothetical protein